MSYTQCQNQCQAQPGKLVPIPLKCGNINILQPAECPQIYIPSSEIGFCELVLLPDTDDPLGILVNLPVLLLFTISAPARFLYCSLLYNAIISADFFTVIENIIDTALDIILNPFFSAVQGFINGDNGANFNPGSVVNSAIIPQTCLFQIPVLGTIINAIDEAFYTIGYAFGFLFYLIKYLYDTILEIVCFVPYFGIQFCGGFGIDILGTCYGACGCTECVQPFSFLQPLVDSIINCQCFGNEFCYTLSLHLGCNVDNCGNTNTGSTCGNQGQSESGSNINYNPSEHSHTRPPR